MKKIIAVLLSASLALLTSAAFAKKSSKGGTVEIVHKPDEQAIIITINENALEAHLAHGDCVFDDNGGGGGGGDDDDEPLDRKPDGGSDYCEDIDYEF